MQQFPLCQEHQESQKEFLLINPLSVKLLCSECLFLRTTELFNIDVGSILHLKKLNIPKLLEKILPKYDKNQLKYEGLVNSLIQCFEVRLWEIEKMRKDLQQLHNDTVDIILNFQKILEDLISGLNQNLDLDSLYQTFTSLTDNQENGSEIQIFQCIEKYRESYYKNYYNFKESLLQKLCFDQKKLEDEYQNLTRLFSLRDYSIYGKQETIVNQLSEIIEPKVLDRGQFFHLINSIEQRQKRNISKIKKLYFGSRNEFSITELISQLYSKQKLLMIFKSGAGQIFGGFTTTEFQSAEDSERISFLFSISKSLIYPMKNIPGAEAFKISKDLGIRYGGLPVPGKLQSEFYDLVIEPNFKGGFSKLGKVYNAQIPENEIPTYLFGATEPNISELEVYELL